MGLTHGYRKQHLSVVLTLGGEKTDTGRGKNRGGCWSYSYMWAERSGPGAGPGADPGADPGAGPRSGCGFHRLSVILMFVT